MKALIIILLFAVLMIAGCTSTKRIVVESEYIRAVMRTGAPVEAIKSADLTDIELIKLTHAANVFQDFSDKWKTPADALKYGGEELKQDYRKVKQGYLDAYGIARNNWNEYSTETQGQLQEWDRHARRFDDAALDYMKLEQYIDMAGQVAEYARIGAGLIIGMATK